jgi:hypothetical protein
MFGASNTATSSGEPRAYDPLLTVSSFGIGHVLGIGPERHQIISASVCERLGETVNAERARRFSRSHLGQYRRVARGNNGRPR